MSNSKSIPLIAQIKIESEGIIEEFFIATKSDINNNIISVKSDLWIAAKDAIQKLEKQFYVNEYCYKIIEYKIFEQKLIDSFKKSISRDTNLKTMMLAEKKVYYKTEEDIAVYFKDGRFYDTKQYTSKLKKSYLYNGYITIYNEKFTQIYAGKINEGNYTYQIIDRCWDCGTPILENMTICEKCGHRFCEECGLCLCSYGWWWY